jgi:F1F0 ATPase subunit 2
MMSIFKIIWLIAAGGFLGAFFFLGLSWTISRGLNSKFAALWFPASLLVRLSVTLGGLYLVSSCQFERLSLCLLGFIASGCVAVIFAKPVCLRGEKSTGVTHAP